jgi:hypothetical protein
MAFHSRIWREFMAFWYIVSSKDTFRIESSRQLASWICCDIWHQIKALSKILILRPFWFYWLNSTCFLGFIFHREIFSFASTFYNASQYFCSVFHEFYENNFIIFYANFWKKSELNIVSKSKSYLRFKIIPFLRKLHLNFFEHTILQSVNLASRPTLKHASVDFQRLKCKMKLKSRWNTYIRT